MVDSNKINEVRQTMAWIISTRHDIVNKTLLIQQGKYNPKTDQENLSIDQEILEKIKDLIIVNPDDLHGKVYVTKELQTNSKITAGSITLANWINCVSNFPLFLFLVQNIHPIIGFSSAIASTGILLGTGNILGAGVARYKKGNRSWSLLGALVGLVGLNILQTGATGIGVELFNNRSQLDGIYAEKIADDYIANKEAEVNKLSQFDDPIYQTAKQKCEQGEAKLSNLPHSNPGWDALFVKLYGSYSDKDKNWDSVTYEQLPICRQVTRLENEQNQRLQKASISYQSLLTNRADTGSDLKFLQTYAPDVFQQHFSEQGEIKSGPILVGLATTQVYTKLFNGQWSELGLSLFMFVLSAITSVAACVMALCHALSKDVQLSYDLELQAKIDAYFQELRFALMEAQKQGIELFPNPDQDSDKNSDKDPDVEIISDLDFDLNKERLLLEKTYDTLEIENEENEENDTF